MNTNNTFEEGKVILIDKPLRWTSFDVVRKIRNLIRIKKVGHAGTLDPLATGLLIICTGKFTKRINEYSFGTFEIYHIQTKNRGCPRSEPGHEPNAKSEREERILKD